MADGANTKEYWDEHWSSQKNMGEKWCMNRAVWLIRRSKAKSVLDIGCGKGKTLRLVRDLDCYGIDISKKAIDYLKKKYEIDGEVLDVDDMDKLKRKFDFIVCSHVLEHVQEDKRLIQNCYNTLNKGGTLFIAVPNDFSGPEDTIFHMRKYNMKNLKKLIEEIFDSAEMGVMGHNLLAVSIK